MGLQHNKVGLIKHKPGEVFWQLKLIQCNVYEGNPVFGYRSFNISL